MARVAQSLDALHRNKLTDVRKTNLFHAYPKDIHMEEGFNVRDYSRPATQEHIRSLADAYIAGRFVPPVIVRVVDGRISLVDGYCRRQGMDLAMSEGADLGQVMVTEFKGDQIEADALVLTTNNGLKLLPLERAAKYFQMSNRGKSEADIAELVGSSSQSVRQYLDMHQMPAELKAMVNDDIVSATQALKTFRQHGSSAVEVISKAHTVSSNGRVTEKDVKKSAGKDRMPAQRVGKKTVSALVTQVRTFGAKIDSIKVREDGSASVDLTAEELDAFRNLCASLPVEKDAAHTN